MRSFTKMWALLREASHTSCSKASLASNSRKPYHPSITGVRDEVFWGMLRVFLEPERIAVASNKETKSIYTGREGELIA